MPDIGKDIRPPSAEDYHRFPRLTVPGYTGGSQPYDTYGQYKAQLKAITMAQLQHRQQSIPATYLSPPPPEPSTGIRPAARPRPRNWPWLFAILSPIILPAILVYTLGKHIREWGEFIEDWFHEVTA